VAKSADLIKWCIIQNLSALCNSKKSFNSLPWQNCGILFYDSRSLRFTYSFTCAYIR